MTFRPPPLGKRIRRFRKGSFLQVIPEVNAGGCGPRSKGELVCLSGATTIVDEAPPAQFLRVSIEQSYACALRPDGRAVQWSLGGVSAEPGDRVFIEVANSYGVCCGLSDAGRVYCSEASYPLPQEE